MQNMNDLNKNDMLYHIVRNKCSRMSWRHHCYGFDVFEITTIYIEELDKLQWNELILNDFLINIIMMIYQMLYRQLQRKGIPFMTYQTQSPLAAVITDLHQIDQEIDNLTNLFLKEVFFSSFALSVLNSAFCRFKRFWIVFEMLSSTEHLLLCSVVDNITSFTWSNLDGRKSPDGVLGRYFFLLWLDWHLSIVFQ